MHRGKDGIRESTKKKKKITKTLVWVYDYVWLSICLRFFFPPSISAGFVFLQSRSHLSSLCPLHISVFVCLSQKDTKCVAHLCLSQPVCPVQRKILCNVIFCTQKTDGLQLKITFHYALVNWFSKLIQKMRKTLITISLSPSWRLQMLFLSNQVLFYYRRW